MVSIQEMSHRAVLVIPRLRIQNANAISSPMTWGFPSITAFTGLMTALERRLGPEAGVQLMGVGVVCHAFEAQVTTEGYTRAFHLTRNPVLQDGSTAAIVEEGRVHLEVSLVFQVQLADAHRGEPEREALASRVAQELAGMRVAGGSVMPPLPGALRSARRPILWMLPDDDQFDAQRKLMRRLARGLMPGFALVSRDDLLAQRLQELRQANPEASVWDAWLDWCRLTSRPAAAEAPMAADGQQPSPDGEGTAVEWMTERRPGWIVPIPVGYAPLSPLQPAGSVRGARDMVTPFRFVETVWSIGQWISPHRLRRLGDFIWQAGAQGDPDQPDAPSLYRCFIEQPADSALTL